MILFTITAYLISALKNFRRQAGDRRLAQREKFCRGVDG